MALSYKSRELVGFFIGLLSVLFALSPFPIFYLAILGLSLLISYEISRAIGFRYFLFAPITLFFSSLSFELGLLCALLLSFYAGWRSWLFEDLFKSLLVCLYAGLLLVFLLQLKQMEGYSLLKLLLFVWAVDVFSYYTGKKFGRHPLATRLSPKKTWEGLVGGAIAGFLVLLLFYGLKALLWSPLMVATALLGDLFKSYIKRIVGIKDFSHLLGEHGGFTDRFDSLTFTAPLYLFLLKF
ncbi:MAG: phosphatidate cytidylyltransferase [Aquificaceae bacterium]